ncbi:MAG: imidazole glycerol phosphate synthase subunit HisH [Verrucomicrobiae bacterium]|nr:imidazole glycerol phosphate synthase subunit HisH [Verrucomicrobiae bacterium]
MIGMIDYGMGNLRSVEKALEKAGARVTRVTDAAGLSGIDRLVVPGQGAFRDFVAHLEASGLRDGILAWLRSDRPFLGICLGQQALFETSFENGVHRGLGFFRGTVDRLDAPGLKIPQIGWNQVRYARPECPLFEGIPDGTHFYFDHSFRAKPAEADAVAGVTDYGERFASVVWRDRCFAVQFHPEKSQRAGIQMLANFVAL